MAEWTGYLTDEELDDLRMAAIRADLVTSESASLLLSRMDRVFAASLPTGGNPNMRLFGQLQKLNRVHNLRNGDVPLAQWLQTAIALASELPQRDFFEAMLAKLSQSSLPPAAARVAAPAPDVADALGSLEVLVLEPAEDSAGNSPPGTRGVTVEVAEVLRAPSGSPPSGSPASDSSSPFNLNIRPEAQIASSDETVSVHFLNRALTTSRSVAKVLVHRHDAGQPSFLGDRPWLVNGTGWFIAPHLLITNHHVINARRTVMQPEAPASDQDFKLQAENTTVILDYFDDNVQSERVASGAGALEAADVDLDFAILRLPTIDRGALQRVNHLIRKTVEQPLGSRVNVLQHPHGQPMVLGFRDNFVVQGDEQLLTYLTDTNSGSSGSPVCNDRWQVAALHSGSRNIAAQNIKIRGQQVRSENFGIPILTIMAHLETHHPQLHAEIIG